MASETEDTAVIEFTEENAEKTGLSGVEKRKEADILLLQIKKRKRTEKTKVTKLRHELEKVCLKDSELPVIESVIEQLWTALENAQETLEELIAFLYISQNFIMARFPAFERNKLHQTLKPVSTSP